MHMYEYSRLVSFSKFRLRNNSNIQHRSLWIASFFEELQWLAIPSGRDSGSLLAGLFVCRPVDRVCALPVVARANALSANAVRIERAFLGTVKSVTPCWMLSMDASSWSRAKSYRKTSRACLDLEFVQMRLDRMKSNGITKFFCGRNCGHCVRLHSSIASIASVCSTHITKQALLTHSLASSSSAK